MKEVYVLKFNEIYDDSDIEFCDTKETAIICAKEYLKEHDVEEVKSTKINNDLVFSGRGELGNNYTVRIYKQEVFSSVDEFMPARFAYLRKE